MVSFPTKRHAMSDADMAVVRTLEVVVHKAMRAKHERWYADQVIAVRVTHERRALSRPVLMKR